MSQWQVIFSATLAIFGMLGVGATARKLNWLTEEADATLLKLIIRLLFPALVLHVILGNPRLREPENLIVPPLVGAGTILLGFALGALVAHVFRKPLRLDTPLHRRAFIFCVGMYNYGYLPLPVSDALFGLGSSTTGVLFIHNVGVEVVLWSVGVTILSGGLGPGWIKRMLNPVVLTIFVALTINLLGLYRYIPSTVFQLLEMLGRTAIPVSLLVSGAAIADVYRSSRLRENLRVMTAACLLRLGALPAMFILLAWWMQPSIELQRVMVIQAAMPAAVLPIVLARLYKADVATAVRVVIATSVISLVTAPLWLTWGLSRLHLLP